MMWAVAVVFAFFLLGFASGYVFVRRRPEGTAPTAAVPSAVAPPDEALVFQVIQSRRSVAPKDFNGQRLDAHQLRLILQAANWAPTHKNTEPWRFVVFSGCEPIMDYLDFIERWYHAHDDQLDDESVTQFRLKIASIRFDWPMKVSDLVVIGLRRTPDKLPEWEELSAVAMAVQNMHLMATAMPDVVAFWSSHTWCRGARDSVEMRRFLNWDDCPDNRVLGAFLIGKMKPSERAALKSRRTPIDTKVQHRCSREL